jgi:hypothetical protein
VTRGRFVPPRAGSVLSARFVVAGIAVAGIVVTGAVVTGSPALAGTTLVAPTAPIEDAIALSWDGDSFDTFLSGALFPSPRVVPGDTEVRTFVVRNDGPGPGILTAEIVEVQLAGDTTDPFYDEFELEGAPVISYLGHDTAILEQGLAAGETTEIGIDYGFPVESTVGNHPIEGTVQVEFQVRLTLQGEDPGPTPTPTPEPTTTPTPGPSPTATSGSDPDPAPTPAPSPEPSDGTQPPLSSTGASVAGPAIVGLALLLLGGTALAVSRSRRRREP